MKSISKTHDLSAILGALLMFGFVAGTVSHSARAHARPQTQLEIYEVTAKQFLKQQLFELKKNPSAYASLSSKTLFPGNRFVASQFSWTGSPAHSAKFLVMNNRYIGVIVQLQNGGFDGVLFSGAENFKYGDTAEATGSVSRSGATLYLGLSERDFKKVMTLNGLPFDARG